MTDRDDQISAFLQRIGRGEWSRAPLAGDASARSYQRLTSPDGRCLVLMDSPPASGETIRSFVRIANYLRSLDLSAPAIIAEDEDNGFLLTEDLGDQRFYEQLNQDPSQEKMLYSLATDFLVQLHKTSGSQVMPSLDPLGPRVMAEMSSLVIERYCNGIKGTVNSDLQSRFENQFEDILRQNVKGDMVFVHRDFHVQNLMYLPDREGLAQVGVIDFQDARLGHRAYDLVSLLQDARRDVPAAIEARMINRYLAATGLDASRFRSAYAVIGVQRNLRILGVFARLSQDFGKPYYIDLIPRVWAHVINGLEHPALAPLADWLLKELPAPTPENLAKLR
ncbi:aminoglycoside phosphotransferase family protein [Pseudophaeobacter sp. EL27]|uniref:aminoglycoside phosphotransferase family protein n=1 Tax=Pseudophaeobacter sp. EL27 TaxID=2107580 RepID=UPI000EFBB785|nr:phosphotransferase [Pseudophaeobacter sp. EL27]